MAGLERRSTVKSRSASVSSSSKPPGRYHQEAASKSRASVSVSSVPKTNETRPKLQRSASTTHTKSGSTVQDKGDQNVKEVGKKHHRRNSSIFGSLFRRPSAPATTATPNPNPNPPTPRVRTAECLTCGSDDVPISRSAKLPCSHRMCNSCLRRIFILSIKDPQHMPPRCCASENIPLSSVSHLFDDKFKLTWNRKYQEYTTKNRVYCPNCSQWIKPGDTHKLKGRKYGLCPRCKTKVCTLCNNKFHSSGECPNDPETSRLLDMATEQGWQRCYGCKAMVELKEGCNHMTCRCGSQFCMICASPWKTCECPWFNYTRTADGDGLNHMRVPRHVVAPQQTPPSNEQPRRNTHHTFNDSHTRNEQPPPPPPPPPHQRNERNDRSTPALTYQQELEARQRQERADEALARRLQASSLHTPLIRTPSTRTQQPQRRPLTATTTTQPLHRTASTHPSPSTTTLSTTNRPSHTRRATTTQIATETLFGPPPPNHLNTSYTTSPTHIGDLGDPFLARRGERESGRRSARRYSVALDPGLVGDAFGTESMLGMIPPPSMGMTMMGGGIEGTMQRRTSLRQRLGSLRREDGKERIGGWLNKVG